MTTQEFKQELRLGNLVVYPNRHADGMDRIFCVAAIPYGSSIHLRDGKQNILRCRD